MIEVFKTNVECSDVASELLTILVNSFPHFIINFDLEDCDKILRVEAISLNPDKIIRLLNDRGYWCEVLE